VKIWVDDREGTVSKLQPNVYRAIIAEAHTRGMEVLAHLSRTSALADAKDLFKAGVDGYVHLVRDRDVDAEYLALVKAHPRVWSGPNIPVPQTRSVMDSLAETLPPAQVARMRADVERREANGNLADKAVHGNLPVTFVNHPDGPHAFDLFHDSLTSRDITARRSDSCGAIWALLDRSRPVGTPDRYDIVRSRFYRCSM
jgi:hypothetical protein